MKFTIPAYLVLLAYLATGLALPPQADIWPPGIAIRDRDQTDRTTSDSFSGTFVNGPTNAPQPTIL